MRETIHTEPGERGSWRPSLEEIHGEMRIEYEQCQDEGIPVVFLQIGVEGLERIEAVRGSEGKELVLIAITNLLRGKPRDGDLYAYRQAGGLIAMITSMPIEAGEIMSQQLVDECRKLELPEDRGSLRLNVCIGLSAGLPGDEYFFETMLCVAEEGAVVASAGGGGCYVHSQLYGLHQRKLEREMPERLEAARLRKEKRAQETAAAKLAATTKPTTDASRAAGASAAPTPAVNGNRAAALSLHEARSLPSQPSAMPDSIDLETETQNLHERLRGLLATGKRPAATPLEGDVLELADRWAQEVLRRALEAQATEHRMELSLLERRVKKLDRALQDSEEELRQVANTTTVDYGLHSAYRTVQGLSADEQQYELKHSLMEQLLEANLELHEQISLNN